jgi:hypothetical protein
VFDDDDDDDDDDDGVDVLLFHTAAMKGALQPHTSS